MEMVDVEFSYQDPPYKVRQALMDLMLAHRRRPRQAERRLRRRWATVISASNTA